ncbi:Bifunctional coenzyme PQQ synthesis C/D [Gossypium arboreum]|uniref:Bifunctional coenzyme PQQ synthesis C/D n=1 Tax=Gossypium arboreum TaxID=29729 RepID=A0A0B0MWN5_GOSAR|nr:Bifunctional coenzyme PQQ synthesis C/D [Gossypium arboreum]
MYIPVPTCTLSSTYSSRLLIELPLELPVEHSEYYRIQWDFTPKCLIYSQCYLISHITCFSLLSYSRVCSHRLLGIRNIYRTTQPLAEYTRPVPRCKNKCHIHHELRPQLNEFRCHKYHELKPQLNEFRS